MGTRPRPPAQHPPSASDAFATTLAARELGDAARREVLAFPAEYLRDVPVPLTVQLRAAGLGAGSIAVVSRRLQNAAGPRPDETDVVFDGDELRAIAVGVQSERLRPADFRAFCLRKRVDPSFRLTEELALDGARAEPTRPGNPPWSLARVLQWLELDVMALQYSSVDTVECPARAA